MSGEQFEANDETGAVRVRLIDLVVCGAAVAATRARTAKTAALATVLARTSAEDMAATIGLLVGEPRQGRVGVGWATAFGIDVTAATTPSLTVHDVDMAISELEHAIGSGSAGAREVILRALFARATSAEADYLRRMFVGEMRQGALDAIVTDALAAALTLPVALVRRGAMLLGDLGAVGVVAKLGGAPALGELRLEVGRPIQPMLASPATDMTAALEGLADAIVEWKLDGIRIQVHKRGDAVTVFTRNLNEITTRVPNIVAIVRNCGATDVVLDGEAMGWYDRDTPIPFQHTMSRAARQGDPATPSRAARQGDPAKPSRAARQGDPATPSGIARVEEVIEAGTLRPHFFDCLHHDGVDLLDRPLSERLDVLERVVPENRMVGVRTGDAVRAAQVEADALAAGHEGVVVKDLSSRYEAGRRGSAWRKVKPVRTFDLVVLAAEWGHGRRTGWLSNLHLGARDEASGFVMVGKTFKGLTDALLKYQTEQFLEIEAWRTASTVFVHHRMVVEIAIDGVQASTRYPGGVALRFARVKRYREDKDPLDADTITSLQALLPPR